MPTTTRYNANLTASTKTANIIAGDVVEFVTVPSLVEVYQTSSAIGVNSSILADSDVIVEDKEIPFIGTTVNEKDHLMAQFGVAAGTRLTVFLRETAAAGTTDVYTVVKITPLA